MLRSILFFFICVSSASAITLTQTVATDILFDLNLVAPTDAGDYFNDSYTQTNTLLSIDNIPDDTKWKVYAKLSNFVYNGHEKIRIAIKRNGDGTGVHPVYAGNAYHRLDETTYKYIFRGEGSHFDIPITTKIRGIGVTDNIGTHNTTIEYKVETY